jgi:hypothetical protein
MHLCLHRICEWLRLRLHPRWLCPGASPFMVDGSAEELHPSWLMTPPELALHGTLAVPATWGMPDCGPPATWLHTILRICDELVKSSRKDWVGDEFHGREWGSGITRLREPSVLTIEERELASTHLHHTIRRFQSYAKNACRVCSFSGRPKNNFFVNVLVTH